MTKLKYHVLKTYNEKAPVRLIFPTKIHEDEIKEPCLQSFIHHVRNLNFL